MKFLVKLSCDSYSLYCSFEHFNHISAFQQACKVLEKKLYISFNFKVLENKSISYKKCLKMKGLL